jgi:5-methylcytosine-specific restriction enzyme subunit McrC
MANRVENKLLKSTINLLLKKTNDYQNKKALRQQLFVFDDVNISQNYESDISKINMHRGMEYYELPLKFAKVFLKDKSFTSLRGKENVYALLFPMEKVFENYMEFVLNNSKEALGIKNILVNGRRNEYFLGSGKCKMARLQPDYLLEMKGSKDIVTDAKWKILDIKEDETKDCERVSISSNDVYQIFSYLHFYDCEYTAYLFVPQTIDFQKEVTFDYTLQVDQILKRSNKRIKVIPIDLNILKFNNHKLMLNIFEEKN